MTDQIVITEKSSQAKDVRAAVGGRYGAVLPAEGHLLDLCEPEDVNPAWKRWSAVLLRPDELYGTKPASGGNKSAKLKAIRAALRTAECLALRRGRSPAGPSQGGQGDRHAGNAGGNHRRAEEAGIPDGPGTEHRTDRPRTGAVRGSRTRRSGLGRSGGDGGTRMPARRCGDRQTGDDGRDRRGVRCRPAHHRQPRGRRRCRGGCRTRGISRWGKRRRAATDGGAQRKWLSEAPNGWIKEVLGFRRFSLRGLAKVRGEWDLVCLALNIKRMGTVATC